MTGIFEMHRYRNGKLVKVYGVIVDDMIILCPCIDSAKFVYEGGSLSDWLATQI